MRFFGGIDGTVTKLVSQYPPHYRNTFRNLSVGMLLATSFFFAQAVQSQTPVLAASQSTPTSSPLPNGNGHMVAPPLTAQQIAFGNAKQLMAQEYMRVVQGKEPLAVYEQHMTLFMKQHNLGNVANLHQVLTHSLSNKARVAAGLSPQASSPTCPSVVQHGGITPYCPVATGAAQFPEERSNYCGNATISTLLVEDSFIWGSGVLTHGSDTLTYNPYTTTQYASTALADEDILSQSSSDPTKNYLANTYNPNTPNSEPGADPGPMLTTINDFVNGNGGNYAPVSYGNVNANFQNDLVSDINQGWDLAGGLKITGNSRDGTLTGYPAGRAFDHWIPITYYTNGGATTYYADPTHAAPDYLSWGVPGPYASTSTSNMIKILTRLTYLW